MILKTARKLVVLVIGGTALLLGVVMLVTPGPGIVGIFAGLAILATEFVWARTLLKRVKQRAAALIPGASGDAAKLKGRTPGPTSM
jgi:tellurite resistance protein TerC